LTVRPRPVFSDYGGHGDSPLSDEAAPEVSGFSVTSLDMLYSLFFQIGVTLMPPRVRFIPSAQSLGLIEFNGCFAHGIFPFPQDRVSFSSFLGLGESRSI